MLDGEFCRELSKTKWLRYCFYSVGMMDSVNSTTFIKRPPFMTDAQEKFLYTKELLSGRIFLGSFLEKRYVTVLQEYRDVVYLNSDETDLQNDLDKVRKKWSGEKFLKWVGITGPDEFGFPKAYCLWVKLTNLAIGQYWFQIKHVKLVDQEIVFQLKCIRKSQIPLCAITPEMKEIKPKGKNSDKKSKKAGISDSVHSTPAGISAGFEPQKTFTTLQDTCTEAIHTLRPFLTVSNFVTVVRVACALTIALVMGIISIIGHLGEYVLKLIREFTLLVNAFTPIVVQLIDFLSKIIGGLFILIAGMFRNGTHPPPPPPSLFVQPYRNQILYRTAQVDRTRGPLQAVDWRERNRILRQELFSNSPKTK